MSYAQEMQVSKTTKRLCTFLIFASLLCAGCSSNQTVKNAWKGTKGVWYTYISPPASIDYSEKGDMDAHELALATRMMGIDIQLSLLERVMNNADKPPTGEWMQAFFARFPWMDGFAGVKADGEIIGQEPSMPMKPLEFSPLLEEDKKQNLRALRGHVQDTPMGPEVFLAAPLYDAQDFLGIVTAYFDMRNLLRYSTNPEEIVIVSPEALLWSGKYDYEATPLAGVKWDELVTKTTKGTVSNANGTFYWVARFLGNQPLIFAVPVAGNFPEKANRADGPTSDRAFSAPLVTGGRPSPSPVLDQHEILPGSDDSVLLPHNAARPSPFGPKAPTPERSLD